MIESTIDRADQVTGQEADAPEALLAAVRHADGVLRERFAVADDVGWQARWSRLRPGADGVWTVSLDVSAPDYQFGEQFRVDQLCDPATAKELVGEAVWRFTRGLSDKVGADLRQLRADLRQLRADLTQQPVTAGG